MTNTMGDAALEVHGVTKSYGDTEVLHGLNLRVGSGITAILGASGCGKTTLLRLVAGFLRPDQGSISLGGTVVADGSRGRAWVGPRARRVGYVPQEGALFPHLDVAANIAFGLPRDDRSATSARVAEMLDLVGLAESMASRHPHQLSGGQQQRVALARALAPAPGLVLLDEPFSSLDTSLREETGFAVARALSESGAAALLVTHDRAEALSLGDEVAVMAHGTFLQVAHPTQIYRNPVSVEVASFVNDTVVLPAARLGAGVGNHTFLATCALGTVVVTPDSQHPMSGQPFVVSLRQEQIELLRDPPAPGDPAVSATVTDVLFFGRQTVVRTVVGDDGTVVTARLSGEDGAAPISLGAQVWLSVRGTVSAFEAER